jgi:hypothetical protein
VGGRKFDAERRATSSFAVKLPKPALSAMHQIGHIERFFFVEKNPNKKASRRANNAMLGNATQ